jgi:hypothetical protein
MLRDHCRAHKYYKIDILPVSVYFSTFVLPIMALVHLELCSPALILTLNEQFVSKIGYHPTVPVGPL